jgi:DNA-binding MarR family transcriptional regulator
MNLPKITPQQQALLRQLYNYRYLERSQIQSLLGHTDKRRISAWLKDLREKHYIDWIYNPNDFIQKSRPAIYYLGLNGIRYLRTLNEYPANELRKRYKDATRQPDFIAKCVLVASCSTTLQAQNSDKLQYTCVTESDYLDPANDYHFLNELKPHLYFTKQEDGIITNYLLEIFNTTIPRYMVKKRLKDYLAFVTNGDWEQAMDTQPPFMRFVCPNTTELIYVKRRLRKSLEDENIEVNAKIVLAEKIKEHGIIGNVWEEI